MQAAPQDTELAGIGQRVAKRRRSNRRDRSVDIRGSKKMPAPQSAIRRRQWRVHTETLIAQPGAAAMAPPPYQLDGPSQAWCFGPRPRGSAFGFLPGDVLGQHQGSSPPERRCLILAPKLRVVCPTPDSWRAKFSQTPSIAKSVRLGRTTRGRRRQETISDGSRVGDRTKVHTLECQDSLAQGGKGGRHRDAHASD